VRFETGQLTEEMNAVRRVFGFAPQLGASAAKGER